MNSLINSEYIISLHSGCNLLSEMAVLPFEPPLPPVSPPSTPPPPPETPHFISDAVVESICHGLRATFARDLIKRAVDPAILHKTTEWLNNEERAYFRNNNIISTENAHKSDVSALKPPLTIKIKKIIKPGGDSTQGENLKSPLVNVVEPPPLVVKTTALAHENDTTNNNSNLQKKIKFLDYLLLEEDSFPLFESNDNNNNSNNHNSKNEMLTGKSSKGVIAKVRTTADIDNRCLKKNKMKLRKPIKDKKKSVAFIPKEKAVQTHLPTAELLLQHLDHTYALPSPRDSKFYTQRTAEMEKKIEFAFLTEGLDAEDMMYLQRAYEGLSAEEIDELKAINVCWGHYPTPPETGVDTCARAEGHYDRLKKSNTSVVLTAGVSHMANITEIQNFQRHFLTESDSDAFKLNQLHMRRKRLKFGRSSIDGWGLFAGEKIAPDEMILEYVGEIIRTQVAEVREAQYKRKGIMESYFFALDRNYAIDATRYGNLSRLINHSCNPNCYAKYLTVDGRKRIVIYSKREILENEELTYDYKFPYEEKKIQCFCKSSKCRGFLN